MFGEIRNALGERIDYSFTGGDRDELVVIGHGVTANKDREWAVTLAGELATAGIASLRMSFSGNGDSEGDFAASTVTKEVDDLRAVLDAVGPRRIVYAGHSMGGAVGVLAARADARIRVLISLAGMVHTREFAERKFGHLQPGRDTMWDKPECPLSQTFLDDMRRIDNVLEQAAGIDAPWLLVHGTADDVVPIRDSLDVIARTGPNAELVRLEGIDHVFSGGGATEMAAAVLQWLRAVIERDERS